MRLSFAGMVVAAAVLAAGCDMAMGHLGGTATDEWTRSYPLTRGGELQIVNTNGRIEIEPSDGSTVDVRAERIAKAATDDGAREILPRIKISETVKPDHVTLETERLSGVMIGVNMEVRYHVKAPKDAFVHVRNTNGQVTVNGMTGKLSAETTNGAVVAEMAAVTAKIEASTTNGSVTLTLPADAKGDLTASVTNGGISVTGLKLETTEQSRRRIEGRLNGGGPSIDVHTTNGAVRIRAKGAAGS
jgi:hypothetical protein